MLELPQLEPQDVLSSEIIPLSLVDSFYTLKGNSHPKFTFRASDEDLNTYLVNNKKFKIEDNHLIFDNNEPIKITPKFFEYFKNGSQVNHSELTDDEQKALFPFIIYAEPEINPRDTKSILSKTLYINI